MTEEAWEANAIMYIMEGLLRLIVKMFIRAAAHPSGTSSTAHNHTCTTRVNMKLYDIDINNHTPYDSATPTAELEFYSNDNVIATRAGATSLLTSEPVPPIPMLFNLFQTEAIM